ncbi:MAG TPA: hypothetical protein DCL77_00275 [Prolixibacteraceae bacterium]|jgi:DUF1680 family protein|nr:hypothetical protein [Prolixibacteraceae bacterium]
MKSLPIVIVFIFLIHGFLVAQTGPVPVKADVFQALESSNIQMKGYLGDKIDLCIAQRIKKQDVQMLIDPFKTRKETHLWQTEFWGKWILSAIAAYEYDHDPEMIAIIRNAVNGLLATQTPDGYIGNYSKDAQLKEWDIWGRKYTLLGLLAYYDISADKKALDAAQKLADHLLTEVGPDKADIVKTGNYHGMPSSSILEPMVLLYRHTGKKRYLDFANYIVAQWETADGPKLISKTTQGKDVANRFPFPKVWWSWDNGQKAYEMMSCYEGLLELYRMTGEPGYLKSAEMAVKNIIDTEINVAGSGTAFECFYHGGQRQTEPTYHTMETCVTFTWIKLCNNLLRLTGNSLYADQIEKTVYNALMASMKFDGTQIAKYSPLEGRRHEGEHQCEMPINCCNANGPRAFTLIPKMALMTAEDEIVVNLYSESRATVTLGEKNKRNKVTLEQNTSYPQTDRVEITVRPEKSGIFTLALRIPEWSAHTSLSVNGSPVEGVIGGLYRKITREWSSGDKVVLQFDMSGRLITLNGYQAIMRGPILLARDSRFDDGFVDETAIVQQTGNKVDLQATIDQPANLWMSFTAPLVLGTDLEGEFRNPRQVHFCDFGSAGNTWSEDSRYRVWIKQTLNVMNAPYKAY